MSNYVFTEIRDDASSYTVIKTGKEWLDSLSEKDRNEMKEYFVAPQYFEWYMKYKMTLRDFIFGGIDCKKSKSGCIYWNAVAGYKLEKL